MIMVLKSIIIQEKQVFLNGLIQILMISGHK